MRWLWILPCIGLLLTISIISQWTASGPATATDVSELLIIDPKDICRAPVSTPQVTMSQTSADDELPIDIEITSAFRLIDQHGNRRARADLFEDKLSLVFFGYASCEGVCLMAIPAIAEAASLLQAEGASVQPVLITIDPARDTSEFLDAQLQRFHSDFIGLTGPEPALANARRMFHIQANPVFEDAKGTVFQHGSFIFLVDREAAVVSMLPPVLPPEQIAQIARKYL